MSTAERRALISVPYAWCTRFLRYQNRWGTVLRSPDFVAIVREVVQKNRRMGSNRIFGANRSITAVRRPLSRCVNSALTAVVAAVHPLALTPHQITVHPKNAALTLVLLALTVATNLKKVRRR